MTTLTRALRVLGLIAVTAAIVDPGCRRPPRDRLAVSMVGEVPALLREQSIRQVAAAAPWADVIDEARPVDLENDAEITARVLVGDPAPVLQALQQRPAHVALRVVPGAVTIRSINVPSRVVTGMRAAVTVGIEVAPATDGVLRTVLRDAASGLEQGRVTTTVARDSRADHRVIVPWLATRVGQVRLRVDVSLERGSPGPAPALRAAPPADVTVEVQPAEAVVSVLEARPTWGARFARLALSGVDGVRLASEVRVAPGVTVTSGPTVPTGNDSHTGDDEADVILVGGVESLSAGDVSRLDRDIRERGRAVVLLVDEPPGPGAWRRLWPESTGVARQAARLRTGLVAGHPWKMREWLTPPVSTGAASLAYLDSESAPFVVGRARGAGRIVLVTALDAWRWRAEPDAAFAAGWRALVQRLAADVPAPLTATVWSTGTGRQRWLHVDAIVGPDVAARSGLTVVGNVEGESPVAVPLVRVDSGRWRGASRVDTTRTRLVAEARAGSLAVGRASAVVDASPLSPAVSWEDVHRHQTERGALATDPDGLSDSLARLRSARTSAEGKRWYATQTWWFAGLALSLLGTEWILRRLHGER